MQSPGRPRTMAGSAGLPRHAPARATDREHGRVVALRGVSTVAAQLSLWEDKPRGGSAEGRGPAAGAWRWPAVRRGGGREGSVLDEDEEGRGLDVFGRLVLAQEPAGHAPIVVSRGGRLVMGDDARVAAADRSGMVRRWAHPRAVVVSALGEHRGQGVGQEQNPSLNSRTSDQREISLLHARRG